jgi:exonuclease III
MNLRFLSWNARSIRNTITNNKFFELRNHLESNFYHLILIQETWLDSKSKVELPNYSCIRKDHNSINKHPHGGVLIFVHKSVVFREIVFCKNEVIDSVFVEISTGTSIFVVGCVYVSPSIDTDSRKKEITKLLSCPGPFILAGDFNAKHTSWNNSNSNRYGVFF